MATDLTCESMTATVVIKTTTDKYRPYPNETSLESMKDMLKNGDFTIEFISSAFTQSRPTIIITEKE